MDVGAPKNIGEEYRWNVPEITYGFDRSFIDFFGPQGIAAVDEAFLILNQLPPASELNPNDFPTYTFREHPRARAMGLLNLKSASLSLVLEQLGLAAPARYVFALRERRVEFVPPETVVTNYLVVQRNFDPISWQASKFLNNVRFTYQVSEFGNPAFADAFEVIVDPSLIYPNTVADFADPFGGRLSPGLYLTGLTRDDVAGIRYLLLPSNLNYENLPGNVSRADSDQAPAVVSALRPGVDKLHFTKITQSWQTDPNWQMNVQFTDRYLSNGIIVSQSLQRQITRPDIVFSAADTGSYEPSLAQVAYTRSAPNFTQTLPNIAGPGILQGPIVITFGKLGPSYYNDSAHRTEEASGFFNFIGTLLWGSYNENTLEPIVFPVTTLTGSPSRMAVSTAQLHTGGTIEVRVRGFPNIIYTIQKSHDLSRWSTATNFSTLDGTFSFTSAVDRTAATVFYRVSSE
jgi:hypothetical protein